MQVKVYLCKRPSQTFIAWTPDDADLVTNCAKQRKGRRRAVVIDAQALRSGTTFQLLLPIPHTTPAALDNHYCNRLLSPAAHQLHPISTALKHCNEAGARFTLDA